MPLPLSPSNAHLLGLMRLHLLPQAVILLNLHRLAGVKLVEAAEIHVLGQQGNHILVEGLPVRVLEVVPGITLAS